METPPVRDGLAARAAGFWREMGADPTALKPFALHRDLVGWSPMKSAPPDKTNSAVPATAVEMSRSSGTARDSLSFMTRGF